MMTIAVDIRSGDGNAMELLECVAFLLIRGNTVLAERRKLTKKVVSGVIAMPGGHLEEGEPPEEALSRELCEELGIVPIDSTMSVRSSSAPKHSANSTISRSTIGQGR